MSFLGELPQPPISTGGPFRARNAIHFKVITAFPCPEGVPCSDGGCGSSHDTAPIVKKSFVILQFIVIKISFIINWY
jgi:hypothetical protein